LRSTREQAFAGRDCRLAPYLDREFAALRNVKVVVVLGKIAFDAYLNYLKRRGELKSKPLFSSATAKHISFRMDIPCYVRIILHCKTR